MRKLIGWKKKLDYNVYTPPLFLFKLCYTIYMMKRKITRKVYQYTAVFEPDEKLGGFTVTVPSLPGCISEGDSFEESLRNIKEAAALYIGVMRDKNFDVPVEEKGIVIAPVEVVV